MEVGRKLGALVRWARSESEIGPTVFCCNIQDQSVMCYNAVRSNVRITLQNTYPTNPVATAVVANMSAVHRPDQTDARVQFWADLPAMARRPSQNT
jgi:hypothetical protein